MAAETGSTMTTDGRRSASGGRTLLVFCAGNAFERDLPENGIIVIGRGSVADVVIDHPTLSRQHARITLGAHVTVEDCNSRNGTSVGGRALAPGEVVLVAPGSPIEIGDALLIVRAAERQDILSASSDDSSKESSLTRTIQRVAEADVSVLVAGETGTGKSFLAKRIHELSSRTDGPFVVLRCAQLTDETVGAVVASARGGILLLHEPGALAPQSQVRLEAALAAEGAGVRTITATARDLHALAQRGAFSTTLLHRLGTVSIGVPPLRARLKELPALVEAIVTEIAHEHQRPMPLVSSDALVALGRHSWPGNVRELRRVLTRAILLGSRRVLTAAHLDLDAAEQAPGAGAGTLSSAVSEAEHRRILEALRQCSGNQTRAAKLLGISRGTLISRLERYAVPRPRK